MRAVIAERYGGPEVLELADVPTPQVGPNGVLVQVHASSVNPMDWKLRKGLLSALWNLRFPVIWGCDLSGVVAQAGSAVTLFKPGDEVYGFKHGKVAKTYRGTYAEYVVVRSVWASSLRVLKRGGRLVTLAIPIPDQPTGKLRFFATALGGMIGGHLQALLRGKRIFFAQVKPRGGDLEKINSLIEAGKLRTEIEKVFPLEQIADAHRLSEQGHVRGKLVIRIGGAT